MPTSPALHPEAPSPRTQKPPRPGYPALFWLAIALLTTLGVFFLPLAFPPAMFTKSSSYIIGFNNRVAAIAVVCISLAVTAILLLKDRGARISAASETPRMPFRWLLLASVAAIAFTAILGGFVVHSKFACHDVTYWQTQIGVWSHDHGVLYRDFEFCYGPLLFYWPAYAEKLLGHIGMGPTAAFVVSLAVLQVIGLAILFYLLQQLPIARRLKGLAFAALTFGTLTPLLGLNYTMARFSVVYAALFWITQKSTLQTQAILAALAELLMLSISPEIGIAFAGGIMAYALYRGSLDERRWLALIPVPVLAFGLFALYIDKNYFYTMANISKGLFNQIIQPFPFVWIFLIAAVGLAPFAIAGYIRRRRRAAGPLVGMYIASLAMVTSALGYCDSIHIFFSSIGLCLLSLIAIDAYTGKWPKIWLAALLVLPICSQALWAGGSAPLIKRFFTQVQDTSAFDFTRLKTITGGQKIYLPISTPAYISTTLLADDELQPSYFSYATNAETPDGMQRKLDEMNHAKYVLMPLGSLKWMTSGVENNWKFRIFRLGYKYPKKRPLFNPGAIVAEDLNQHFVPVETFGTNTEQLMLYRRK